MTNLIKLLVCFLAAFVFGFIVFTINIYMAAIFLGFLLALFIFINIRIAYWIILVNVFFFSTFMMLYVPVMGRRIIWITDLVSLMLILKVLFDIVTKRLNVKIDLETAGIFVFLCLGMVSSVANSVSGIVVICGLRNYFKYIPLFFALKYAETSTKVTHLFAKFFLVIGFLNVPISIFQLIFQKQVDAVGGVFGWGGSGTLTVFQLSVVTYVLTLSRHVKSAKIKLALLCLLLLVPIFMNGTTVSFFLLPLVFLFVFRDLLFKSIFKTIIISSMSFAFIFLLVAIYTITAPEFNPQDLISKRYYVNYLYETPYFSTASLNRGSSIEFAFKKLSSEPIKLLMGVGLGNASESNIASGMGEYQKKYLGMKIDFIFLCKILWEYGVMGTLLYFLIIFRLLKKSLFVFSRSEDIKVKAVANMCAFLTMTLSLTIVYNDSFYREGLGCLFWCLTGCISGIYVKMLKKDAE